VCVKVKRTYTNIRNLRQTQKERFKRCYQLACTDEYLQVNQFIEPKKEVC